MAILSRLKNDHSLLVHGALLPVALLGIYGYAMTYLTLSQILGAPDAIIEGLNSLLSFGVYIINVLAPNFQVNGVIAVWGYLFGFISIAIISLYWLLFLSAGWWYTLPHRKHAIIKTTEGWLLATIYYPLITFGGIALFILFLSLIDTSSK